MIAGFRSLLAWWIGGASTARQVIRADQVCRLDFQNTVARLDPMDTAARLDYLPTVYRVTAN